MPHRTCEPKLPASEHSIRHNPHFPTAAREANGKRSHFPTMDVRAPIPEEASFKRGSSLDECQLLSCRLGRQSSLHQTYSFSKYIEFDYRVTRQAGGSKSHNVIRPLPPSMYARGRVKRAAARSRGDHHRWSKGASPLASSCDRAELLVRFPGFCA